MGAIDSIEVRPARHDDLERIFAIYNHEVAHEVSTFETEPRQVGRDDGWLLDRPERYPVLVAESGDEVIGWASLSPWSSRPAYARTAEVSVYVDRGRRGRGCGRRLLGALIERAPETGAVVLVARIADHDPASLALHGGLGFEVIGVQRRCGEKLGRVLDVTLMDLHLRVG